MVARHAIEPPPRGRAASRPSSPAASVLQPGDRIVAVDGKRGDPTQLREQIATHRCAGEPTQRLQGADAGRARRSSATAQRVTRQRHAASTTPSRSAPLLGFALRLRPDARRRLGPVAAARPSARRDVVRHDAARSATIAQIFKRREAQGDLAASSAPTRRRARRSSSTPTQRARILLALISLSLGVINLFPFLPLDGGHIFWALAEKVRGRAIPFSVMERAGFVGFALVIVLFVIGLTNDIGRLDRRGLRRQVAFAPWRRPPRRRAARRRRAHDRRGVPPHRRGLPGPRRGPHARTTRSR